MRRRCIAGSAASTKESSGKLVPKSLAGGLQKRVDELERALGRKALEVDVLKKTFELKGLKLPEETYGG
jgi:hypothetical protein